NGATPVVRFENNNGSQSPAAADVTKRSIRPSSSISPTANEPTLCSEGTLTPSTAGSPESTTGANVPVPRLRQRCTPLPPSSRSSQPSPSKSSNSRSPCVLAGGPAIGFPSQPAPP